MNKNFVFVYNAETGALNTLVDLVHKIISPNTYPCNLCKITHGPVGEKKEWTEWVRKLSSPPEFLHLDEFFNRYGKNCLAPVIFLKEGSTVKEIISQNQINQIHSLKELKKLLEPFLS